MDNKELRIGNLVSYNDNPFKVWDIGRPTISIDSEELDKHYSNADIFAISPIPLTEEWLLNFGFLNFGKRWSEDKLSLDIIQGEGFYMAHVTEEIKYVHQLQNLYFALTGEELRIK